MPRDALTLAGLSRPALTIVCEPYGRREPITSSGSSPTFGVGQ
jgi:hypothetical protein